MFIILLIMSSLLLAPRLGQSRPLAHPREKRMDVVCEPIASGNQHLSFRDCINAINVMSHDLYNPDEILSFGSGPNVDVQINHRRPLMWFYRTCVIELQVQGNVAQLCSWQRVREETLRIAHECAIVNEAGWTYIDRLPGDLNPAAIVEGPTLQLWMGPYQTPESDETVTCSSNDLESSQHTSEISAMIVGSADTASSRLGAGRTLLNNTVPGCFFSNATKQDNLTDANGP